MTSSSASGRPVRILYSSTFGDLRGGGQRSLLLLLQNLDRTRFAPLLLLPGRGTLGDAAAELGIPVRILPVPPLKRFRPGAVGELVRLLREDGVGLVHTDAPRQAVYVGLAARLAGIPHIWHVRVGEPEPILYEMLLYGLAARVIAVSHAAAERFRRFSRLGRVRVVHNSVDLDLFHARRRDAAAREELGGDGRVIFATFGELTPRKGQEVFLQAAALATRRLPGILRFAVVGEGDGAYAEKLRASAQALGVAGETVFTGLREDAARLMASSDAVVLPTTFVEGFSRVVVEAMASGRPVITTALGGNPEAVQEGETGFLLPPDRDPEALAGRMVRLAADRTLRQSMGEKGRKIAEERFGVADCVRKIEGVYGEVLGSGEPV